MTGTFLIGGELEVHRLGFGCMRLAGPRVTGWPQDRENSIAVLRRARELGVDFFDTADAYGPEVNELQVAEALHPYDGITVATKGGLRRRKLQTLLRRLPGKRSAPWPRDGSPAYLKRACEASLRRLRVEAIDLYQLHRPDPKTPFSESVGALRELKEEGKIRHVGLSNVSVAQLEEARRIVEIASVQNEYNLGNRTSEDVLEACEREGIAFLPWYPLDAGELARPGGPVEEIANAHEATVAQVALAWLLQRSAVTIPIPGTSSLQHLEENVAARELRLTDAELALLGALIRSLQDPNTPTTRTLCKPPATKELHDSDSPTRRARRTLARRNRPGSGCGAEADGHRRAGLHDQPEEVRHRSEDAEARQVRARRHRQVPDPQLPAQGAGWSQQGDEHRPAGDVDVCGDAREGHLHVRLRPARQLDEGHVQGSVTSSIGAIRPSSPMVKAARSSSRSE